MRSELSVMSQAPAAPPAEMALDAPMESAARKVGQGSLFVITEIILGLGAITLVNFLLFQDNLGFLNVAPHPYWLVVLLIPIRYGLFGGIVAGASSALLHMTFQSMQIPGVSILEMSGYQFWGLPLFFLLTGTVLGEVRQSQLMREKRLTMEYADLSDMHERLQQQYRALSDAKEEVDSRIVSQEQTLSTLYESAQALRSLEEKQIYPSVLELLRKYVHVRRSSIYLYQEGRFILAAWIGEGAPPPEEYAAGDNMMTRAVRLGKAQTLNSELFSEHRPEGLLISAPVNDIVTGRVFGVLNVEDIPFLKFNPGNIKLVSLLADWCGSSLSSARLHQETRAKLITDEIIHAYTPEYLRTRLNEEYLRAQRYKLPLSVIGLRLQGLDKLKREVREDALLAFSLALKAKIRAMDLLFLRDHDGGFALILPNTAQEDAKTVATNIQKKFESLTEASGSNLSRVRIRAGIAGYSDALKDPGTLLETAAKGADHDRS